MAEHVSHDDRASGESPHQYHPEYDTFGAWLDAEAPPQQGETIVNEGATAPTQARFDGVRWHCGHCEHDFPTFGQVLEHVHDHHPGRCVSLSASEPPVT